RLTIGLQMVARHPSGSMTEFCQRRARNGLQAKRALVRAEVAENLLDALAFVLVTPEFLGDNRLAYLRRFSRQLGKIGPVVRSLLLDQKWDTGKETTYIKLWCNWLGLLLLVAAGHVLFIYVIKSPGRCGRIAAVVVFCCPCGRHFSRVDSYTGSKMDYVHYW